MNELVRRRSTPDSILKEFSKFNSVFGDMLGWMEGESFFDDFFKIDKRRASAKPKLDVFESDDKFTIVADVAGLSKEDIKVQVHDNHVVITGGKSISTKSEEKDKLVYSELSYREFKRVIPFQCEVEVDTVIATVKDGLLSIVVPKSKCEKPGPKEIEVKFE